MNGYDEMKPKRYVMELANDIERKFPYKASAIFKVRNMYLRGLITEIEAVKALINVHDMEVGK